MAYYKPPINYPTGRISQDVLKINENFTELAKSFVNEDPTTYKVINADKVDDYHASQTPSANTIPVAGSSGKLDAGWLPAGTLVIPFWHILNPINTSTWYIPYATNCTALTTITLTSSRVYYIPFIPPLNIQVTELAIEVTTAATGIGYIGVYTSNNYRPSTLISGSEVYIDTGTTGVKSGTALLNLTAGQLYWLALINSGGATIRAVAVGGVQPLLGIATGGTAWNTHYFQAWSGGTLPTTAGTLSNGTGAQPAIYMRYNLIL